MNLNQYYSKYFFYTLGFLVPVVILSCFIPAGMFGIVPYFFGMNAMVHSFIKNEKRLPSQDEKHGLAQGICGIAIAMNILGVVVSCLCAESDDATQQMLNDMSFIMFIGIFVGSTVLFTTLLYWGTLRCTSNEKLLTKYAKNHQYKANI